MEACQASQGRALMLVSTAIALGIAEGRPLDDLAVIAALFEAIGDQLAILVTVGGLEGGGPGVRQGPSS